MVTKLLSRAEMLAFSEALEAIKQEATGPKTSEYGIVQLSGRRLRSQLKRDSLGSRCTLVSS